MSGVMVVFIELINFFLLISSCEVFFLEDISKCMLFFNDFKG